MTQENFKDDFEHLFKTVIIPFSKELGFKRKAQNFTRQVNDINQCFNVQKSQWNSSDSIRFTFNLGFYNELIRTLSLGREMPTAFPKVTDCFIENRLGDFSHGCDYWYEFNNRKNSSDIPTQVKNDLEKYLKPLFENYQSLKSLQSFFEANTNCLVSPYTQIVFLMLTGQTEKGHQFIMEQHKLALTPQVSTQTIIHPDGRRDVKHSEPYINQYYVEGVERLAKYYGVKLYGQ